MPELGDRFFFSNVDIRTSVLDNYTGLLIYDYSFMFPTKEQAERYMEWHKSFVKLVRKVSQFNDIYKSDGFSYSFYVDETNQVLYRPLVSTSIVFPLFRLRSKKAIEELIKIYSDLIRKVWANPWGYHEEDGKRS